MSTIKVGDRVRTASQLSGEGWSEHHRDRRRPGAVGVARELHAPLTTAEKPWWIVVHGDGSRGCYHAAELTRLPPAARAPIPLRVGDRVSTSQGDGTIERTAPDGSYHVRLEGGPLWSCLASDLTKLLPAAREVASTAGEQTPLEQRVAKLERELDAFRGAVTPELAGLEAAAEQPRVRTSELQALRGLRRVAVVASHRSRQHEGCAWIDANLWMAVEDALQTLDEIEGNDDPRPEIPAPPPSDAGEEVIRLQKRVEELELERDGLRQRNAQALETLRRAFDLRPGCNLITDAADDAADDAAAQLMRLPAVLRPVLTVDELPSVPLLELAQCRAQEGTVAREIKRQLPGSRLGWVLDWLDQCGEGSNQAILADCLAPLNELDGG